MLQNSVNKEALIGTATLGVVLAAGYLIGKDLICL
uniref:Uncharacterized protein n=1 Tax=Anguilla anguilla TaxID=7936 RepID=A0A0E9VMI5_ANGAN